MHGDKTIVNFQFCIWSTIYRKFLARHSVAKNQIVCWMVKIDDQASLWFAIALATRMVYVVAPSDTPKSAGVFDIKVTCPFG